MEIELISKNSIHRILTESFRLRKVCSQFVPHKFTDDQKLLRIQHCKDLIKESKRTKTSNIRLWLVTRRGVFNMIRKQSVKVPNGSIQANQIRKKVASRSQKSKQCWFVFTILKELSTENSSHPAKRLMLVNVLSWCYEAFVVAYSSCLTTIPVKKGVGAFYTIIRRLIDRHLSPIFWPKMAF